MVSWTTMKIKTEANKTTLTPDPPRVQSIMTSTITEVRARPRSGVRMTKTLPKMKRASPLLILFFFLSTITNAQYAPKYKIKLEFEQVGYKKGKKELLSKWHRTIKLREDFHLFLDRVALKKGYRTGVIAGVVYPKKGDLYCSLSLSAVKDLKDEGRTPGNSYEIGEVKFFKIPKSMTFDLPLTEDSGFQRCNVTVIPIE